MSCTVSTPGASNWQEIHFVLVAPNKKELHYSVVSIFTSLPSNYIS